MRTRKMLFLVCVSLLSLSLFNSCTKDSTQESSSAIKLTLVDNSTTGGDQSLLGTSGTINDGEVMFFRIKMTNVSKSIKGVFLLDEKDTLWKSTDTSFAEGSLQLVVVPWRWKVGKRSVKFMVNNGTTTPLESLVYDLTVTPSNKLDVGETMEFRPYDGAGYYTCWGHSNSQGSKAFYTYNMLKNNPSLFKYVDLVCTVNANKKVVFFSPDFITQSDATLPYYTFPGRRNTIFSGSTKTAADFDNATYESLNTLYKNTNGFVFQTIGLSTGDVYLFKSEQDDKIGIFKVTYAGENEYKALTITMKMQK